MNIVRILPIIADDGQPLWQLPHFRAPFLKPHTVYEFSDALVKDNALLRVRSAMIDFHEPVFIRAGDRFAPHA